MAITVYDLSACACCAQDDLDCDSNPTAIPFVLNSAHDLCGTTYDLSLSSHADACGSISTSCMPIGVTTACWTTPSFANPVTEGVTDTSLSGYDGFIYETGTAIGDVALLFSGDPIFYCCGISGEFSYYFSYVLYYKTDQYGDDPAWLNFGAIRVYDLESTFGGFPCCSPDDYDPSPGWTSDSVDSTSPFQYTIEFEAGDAFVAQGSGPIVGDPSATTLRDALFTVMGCGSSNPTWTITITP